MKEELTAKMHSEFAVSKEIEVRHKVWSLLGEAKRRSIDPKDLLPVYGLTQTDVNRHRKSYFRLYK